MTPKPDDRSTLIDPRVAHAWREASNEQPSASVDEAILAAARREVSARPETLATWEAREVRASRRRWWPLAAAATIAAIAVGVLQLTPTDKVVSPATETATVSDVPSPAAKPDAGTAGSVSESPAPPPSGSPPTAPTGTKAAPLQSSKEKATRADDVREKGGAQKIEAQQRSAPAAASTAPAEAKPRAAPALAAAPDPFPAATKAPPENAAAGGHVAAAPPVAAQRAPAAAPAAPPAAAPLAKMAAGPAADSATAEARANDRRPLPVADWIALIRRLRAEGKTDEAAKELAAFRVAHPEHEKLLPPDLRDWRPPEK